MLKEADSIGNYHLTIKDRPGIISIISDSSTDELTDYYW